MAFRVAAFITDSWYKGALWLYLLFPLALLFRIIIFIRKCCYQAGIFTAYRSSLPVVIVGNITVGGTGKSPLVAHLVESFREQGLTPGIVSRGYGSNIGKDEVREVIASSKVSEVGDEPLMLKRSLGCSVIVSPSRELAVQALEKNNCDIVIADDGLQHYALARDIEICVLDGERLMGNGCLLPVGPLREPVARTNTIDFVVINGAAPAEFNRHDECSGTIVRMDLKPGKLSSVSGDGDMELSDLEGMEVNAVAGIGHPDRFFSTLRQQALLVKPYAFEDHHLFTEADFHFSNDLPIIMTEKDAVKCEELGLKNIWYLSVSARLSDDVGARIIKVLKTKGWFDG